VISECVPNHALPHTGATWRVFWVPRFTRRPGRCAVTCSIGGEIPIHLQALFPRLLPQAIAWAEAVAADVITRGTALNALRVADARVVGVQQPENIRVLLVDRLPLPADPDLQAAAVHTGLLGPTVTGLTLGYAMLICHGHLSRRVLSHECRHVAQFEQAGSIATFLPADLSSIVQVGYWNCPFEQDACAHELPDASPHLTTASPADEERSHTP
jgi:hypothetical protein